MSAFTSLSPSRRRLLLASLGTAAVFTLGACGRKPARAALLPDGATVLALGDSLTSGVGAAPDASYPRVLQTLTGWNVVNAGVSGNTSAQALERLPALLQQHQPALVIVCIGGNDFLQRQSQAATLANIKMICQQIKAAGIAAVLVAVPQFSLMAAAGGRLSDHPLYEALADDLKLPLFSGGWTQVLGDPQLRSDAVHANAQGYRQFAQGLAQYLKTAGFLGAVK
ncbi:MAG: arylesterase [Comamonadaceae bacterium]|nr:MAG: arylesterase [Comamonadaceae bacterium]